MQPDNDPIHHLTDADREVETRFGTRPVPEGHHTAAPYPHRPMRSTRIPPSETGPYDAAAPRRRREPSLTGKVLMIGGTAVMAAAATAAAVMAARKLADAVSGDHAHGPIAGAGHRDQRALAPRFADLDEDEREEIRHRAREQARRDQNRSARLRATAARERVAPRGNIARELTDTASDLSTSLNGVVFALTSAMTGFRQVAGQASSLVRDFSDAADAVRSVLNRGDKPTTASAPDQDQDRVRDRTHRL